MFYLPKGFKAKMIGLTTGLVLCRPSLPKGIISSRNHSEEKKKKKDYCVMCIDAQWAELGAAQSST